MVARRYAKAIFGFVVPLAGALLLALATGSPGGDNITQSELIGAVLTAIVTGGAVFAVPNKPPKGELRDPGVSEQAGYGLVELLIAVVIVILIVWLILALF